MIRTASAIRRTGPAAASLTGRLLAAAAVVAVTLTGLTLPAGAAPTNDLASTTAHQVTVTIDRLDPQVIKPNSTITVSGNLTNTTKHTMTAPWVRLQTGQPLTKRAQLTANPPPAAETNATCEAVDLKQDLQPGKAVPYTAKCKASQLGLTDAAGVYPMLVNLNATQFDSSKARVGEANTTLPYFPTKPKAPTRVSWLWPIIDRPHQYTPGLLYGAGHQLPSGVFRDDRLAADLAPSGRLGRLVSAALGAPDSVALTVVIDPALVAQAAAMRQPYRVAHGTATIAGTGRAAATGWLTRLQQLVDRPGVTVVSLPYADPDLVALGDAKPLGEQIGPAYQQGAAVLHKYLQVTHPLSLAWPADGALDNTTLYTLAGQALSGVVMSQTALPLESSSTPTPDAAASIPAQGSTLRAVVTDQRLDDVVGVTKFGGGVRLTRQLFDSELAMITAEAPSKARDVVIAPPRRWATSPSYLADLLADTATLPWATSGSVSDALAVTPTATRGSLTYPASARKAMLPAAQIAQLRTIKGQLDSFRNALSNGDANKLLTPYYRAILTASSSAWRTDHPLGGSFLRDLSAAVSGLQSRVFIVPPSTSSRTYTLASSSSPLVLTVANTLDVAVEVRVKVQARGGSAGFRAKEVRLTVQPGDRPTVKVPAHVDRSGVFSVVATISTAGGQPLGTSVQLKVRSTAYGVITLAITGGAFGLLLLLVGRRLYRRIRAARQPPPPRDPSLDYPTGEYPTLPTTTSSSS